MSVLVTGVVIADFFAHLSIFASTNAHINLSVVDILPSSITTYTGEEAEFRCIAPFNGISWFINDTNVIDVQTIQTRRTFATRLDGNPGEESVLVITTTALANNSAIKCSVQDESGTSVYSSEAQLRTQGLLLPPSNIQLDYQPYSLQTVISWQQPFTLDVTTHQGNKTAISYNIYVCKSQESCEVYDTFNTQYTYYNYSVTTQPSLCNESISFQVSSINRVGESTRSEPLCLRNVLCTSTPGPIEAMSTVTLTNTAGISTNLVTIHSTMYTVHKPNETTGALTTVTIITITVAVPIFVILLLGAVIIAFCSVATKMYSKATRNTSGHVNVMDLTINDAYEIPTKQSDHNLNSLVETKKIDNGYCIEQSESIYAEIA